MSEYQYYEFLAVDRPLTRTQQDELRDLSTRADITATSFVNSYQWGSFRGDPHKLMEHYFDAFLYLANWGTRQVMFRLPAAALDLATARRYCPGESASAWASGRHVILELTTDNEDGEWDEEWDDGHGRLASIVPARAELASGDLRLLYLAWLLAVGRDEVDDDEIEPPVPAGLAELTAPLQSIVDFFRIDPDLLAVAAEASGKLTGGGDADPSLPGWVSTLPAKEKDKLLLRVVRGEATPVRAELLRRFRAAHAAPEAASPTGRRAVGHLRDYAEAHRADRERQAEHERTQEQTRRERAAAQAREQRLDNLAAEGERAWQRVDALIDTKKPREYDAAIALLTDLRALGERDGSAHVFARQIERLHQTHARKPSLVERLERAGLIEM